MYCLILALVVAVAPLGDARRAECSMIFCDVPNCGPGEKIELSESACCPGCVPDPDSCTTQICPEPACIEGEISEVPEGECCPVCVPNPDACTTQECPELACDEGETSELPEGGCCSVCVPIISECEVAGQMFSSCASACPRTCETPDPICIKICLPGCTCPADQVIDTVTMTCVQLHQCPARGECHKEQFKRITNSILSFRI